MKYTESRIKIGKATQLNRNVILKVVKSKVAYSYDGEFNPENSVIYFSEFVIPDIRLIMGRYGKC